MKTVLCVLGQYPQPSSSLTVSIPLFLVSITSAPSGKGIFEYFDRVILSGQNNIEYFNYLCAVEMVVKGLNAPWTGGENEGRICYKCEKGCPRG